MKKILLVENNAFLINIYASQFRRLGYNTSIALGVDVAVNRVKNIGPDLLILDDDLPALNRASFIKSIREDVGLCDLKLVVLSNFGEELAIKESGNGSIKYFSKSENSAEDLAKEVEKILSN